MQVKMKRMHEKAVVPTKAYVGDAGFDLTAVEEVIDTVTRTFTYKTGWAFEIPDGYVGHVYPRSSLNKKDLILANSVGVIDSGYRGEIIVNFKGTVPMGAKKYNVGDRVAQIVIVPIPNVELEVTGELTASNRGTSGHGSSGS